MGILDNLENAWDEDFQIKSNIVKDLIEKDLFWQDLGRPEEDSSLALKMFKEECCDNCSCKSQ